MKMYSICDVFAREKRRKKEKAGFKKESEPTKQAREKRKIERETEKRHADIKCWSKNAAN